MLTQNQRRWAAVWVLIFASALNYLDRMVLNSLMPTLQEVFGVSREQLGLVLSAFSISYAVSSPLMGLLIDRLGLRFGTTIVVAAWSTVGMLTGFAGSFTTLLLCRAALGVAEAGGIPASGKGIGTYLPAEAWALGSALGQVGLTIGSAAAPLLTELLFPLYGWRSAFVVSGAAGFIWIPIWLWTTSRIPVPEKTNGERLPVVQMLGDRRYIALIVANILAMMIYSLWTNWTTLFLVTHFGLSREEANLQFAWIPPWFGTAGGLVGGWLALRSIRSGMPVIDARFRIALGSAVVAISTFLAAMVPGPGWATACICLSFAAGLSLSVNYYSLPIDFFGPERAAFGVSMLTAVYGLMQALLSPLIGRWSEQFGWQPVCAIIGFMPLLSVAVLRLGIGRR